MSDNMTSTLPKKLERSAQLVQNRSELEARLKKAENERTSVKSDIYDRVRKDYETMLEVVLKELIPLQAEIEGSARDWSQKLREAEAQAKETQEKLEELEFRHRVGEFDDDYHVRMEAIFKKQLADLSRQITELRSHLAPFDAPRADSKPAARPAASEMPASAGPGAAPPRSAPTSAAPPERPSAIPDPAPIPIKKSGAPAVKSPEPMGVPVTRTTPAAAAPAATRPVRHADTDDVIDISTWTKEFNKDRQTGATSDASSASGRSAASAAHTTSAGKSPVQSGFPVLIIVGGPGSGKKLPLVPMTMTVGREHDNNIELKDEDVARYHARISFQRGQYVLQDLESSTGTWVNDERITDVVLKQGDKIRVGATEMIIDFE
jgi:hypothetical protein